MEEPLPGHYHWWKSPFLASVPAMEEPFPGHCTTDGRTLSWLLYHRWKSPVAGLCTTVGRALSWPLYHRWKSPSLATVPPVEEPLLGHCTTGGRAPPWPLYHRYKSPFLASVPPVAELHYSLDMLMCRPYSNFGHCEEDENVCLSQESNVKCPIVLPRSPVTVRSDPYVNER